MKKKKAGTKVQSMSSMTRTQMIGTMRTTSGWKMPNTVPTGKDVGIDASVPKENPEDPKVEKDVDAERRPSSHEARLDPGSRKAKEKERKEDVLRAKESVGERAKPTGLPTNTSTSLEATS